MWQLQLWVKICIVLFTFNVVLSLILKTSMIQFVVNGVFAEVLRGTVYDGQKNFRSFCRSFNILFNGSSWFIVNDMLYITVVSNESFLVSDFFFFN